MKATPGKQGLFCHFVCLSYHASWQGRHGTQSTRGGSHIVSTVRKQGWVNADAQLISPFYCQTPAVWFSSSLLIIIGKTLKNISPRRFQIQSSWQCRLAISFCLVHFRCCNSQLCLASALPSSPSLKNEWRQGKVLLCLKWEKSWCYHVNQRKPHVHISITKKGQSSLCCQQQVSRGDTKEGSRRWRGVGIRAEGQCSCTGQAHGICFRLWNQKHGTCGLFWICESLENKQSSKKNIFSDPEVTPGQPRDKVVAELSLENKGGKARRDLRGEIRPRLGGSWGRQGPEDGHEAKKADKWEQR